MTLGHLLILGGLLAMFLLGLVMIVDALSWEWRNR